MTLRRGPTTAAGSGALGLRRGLIRCGAVLLLSFGLIGCSTLSDLSSVFSSEAESPESVAKAEPKAKEGFPTLQDVPDNPPPATSPEAREEIREGLVADRKQARYTDERLRAPLADRPVAPPMPTVQKAAPAAAPSPTVAKETTPMPSPSASASADTSKPVAPPQAPKYVEPPKAPAPPKAPPSGAAAPTAPVTSAALKSETPAAAPPPVETATPMIAILTRGAGGTSRRARGSTASRAYLQESTPLQASPTTDRSVLPRAPDPTMTKGAAAPSATAAGAVVPPAPPAAPTAVAPALSAPDPAMSAPASTISQATGRVPETTVMVSGNVLQDTFNRQMQASASPRFAALGQANAPAAPAATEMASAAATAGAGFEPVTILFATGSSKLSATDRRVVRGLAEQFRTRGGYLRVVGHASSRTRQMTVEQHMLTNFSISLARGQAVAEALIGQGVDPLAIVVEAKGDAEPRYFEAMPNGAARNRRVEIFLEN